MYALICWWLSYICQFYMLLCTHPRNKMTDVHIVVTLSEYVHVCECMCMKGCVLCVPRIVSDPYVCPAWRNVIFIWRRWSFWRENVFKARTMSLDRQSGFQWTELTLCKGWSDTNSCVGCDETLVSDPLSRMVGFQNYTEQIIFVTPQCVMNKNHTVSLRVKFLHRL